MKVEGHEKYTEGRIAILSLMIRYITSAMASKGPCKMCLANAFFEGWGYSYYTILHGYLDSYSF